MNLYQIIETGTFLILSTEDPLLWDTEDFSMDYFELKKCKNYPGSWWFRSIESNTLELKSIYELRNV